MILIVGGGIGGLALSHALGRQGFATCVFERGPQLSVAGAGLAVQPNAMAALSRLGLDAGVREQGVVVRQASICRSDGTKLFTTSFDPEQTGVGAPTVALLRSRLLRVLADSLDGNGIEFGAEVVDLETDDGGVCLKLGDGSTKRGEAVVGCDGVRSVVRGLLCRDGAPLYAGYTCWRGVCPREDGALEDSLCEFWGRGRRFGCVPVDRDQIYWFATANAPEGGADHDAKARLLRDFAGWCPPVQDLLRATPADGVLRTDIHDRAPARAWGRGPATLLGDAAHPMTPDLAQGAGQAIEDAVVLAGCIAAADSIEEGLRTYERGRFDRTAWIVRRSRAFGRMAQLERSFGVALRDAVVRATPQWMGRRQARRLWSSSD